MQCSCMNRAYLQLVSRVRIRSTPGSWRSSGASRGRSRRLRRTSRTVRWNRSCREGIFCRSVLKARLVTSKETPEAAISIGVLSGKGPKDALQINLLLVGHRRQRTPILFGDRIQCAPSCFSEKSPGTPGSLLTIPWSPVPHADWSSAATCRARARVERGALGASAAAGEGTAGSQPPKGGFW